MGQLRSDIARESDMRISALEEMINAISVIKMYCWEKFIVRKIVDYRKNETYYLQWRAFYQGLAKTVPIPNKMVSLKYHLLLGVKEKI